MWSLLYQTIVASNRSVLLILHPQQSTWDWEKSLQLPLLRIALPEISGLVRSLKLWDTPNPAPYNPKSLPGRVLGLPLAENNQRHSFRRRAPCQGRDKERRQLCPDQSSPSARATGGMVVCHMSIFKYIQLSRLGMWAAAIPNLQALNSIQFLALRYQIWLRAREENIILIKYILKLT